MIVLSPSPNKKSLDETDDNTIEKKSQEVKKSQAKAKNRSRTPKAEICIASKASRKSKKNKSPEERKSISPKKLKKSEKKNSKRI